MAPGQRTTRGIGHVIRAIAERGVDTIAIGLGGSSTNDAGAGLLAETGFCFTDAQGNTLWPTLDTLDAIGAATYQRPVPLGRVRLLGLSDVNNPLCGPNGATFVFGPQKGVQDLAAADARLERFAKRCAAVVGLDAADANGSGAAGGIGFALRLLGAEIVPGAAFVLGAAGLDAGLGAFDWVITGEGRSDAQTMMGKGPAMIARMARQAGVPVTLLSGAVEPTPGWPKPSTGAFRFSRGRYRSALRWSMRRHCLRMLLASLRAYTSPPAAWKIAWAYSKRVSPPGETFHTSKIPSPRECWMP